MPDRLDSDQPIFGPVKPDVQPSTEDGSTTAEPVCVADGFFRTGTGLLTRCCVAQCLFDPEKPSLYECAEFRDRLTQFVKGEI